MVIVIILIIVIIVSVSVVVVILLLVLLIFLFPVVLIVVVGPIILLLVAVIVIVVVAVEADAEEIIEYAALASGVTPVSMLAFGSWCWLSEYWSATLENGGLLFLPCQPPNPITAPVQEAPTN